ncbi:acetylornithine transaminase [Kocuria sp. p3-SID1433]|uniref:acetylornithine transaminase n=1 Tax=unclassified Kocuria TaxID=2649579 RepID=UPI0021A3CB18|nr:MULTISPECIES: acetylornithine transaminase [unclassified Kocuria]MCT1601843.1 acetylornithine transaminase [Kocuria sp. p3-SID1428]MCT2180930.1 acetylornithine transaminase [Kocuria sp. p3-SID1433]
MSAQHTDQDTAGQELLEQYGQHLLNVFGAPQAVLVRGQGAEVWDADGNRLLDLLGGIAVNSLGHAHPAWVRAVGEQAATLGHISNFFTSPQQIELARKLLELAEAPEGSRVFFANSGSEANEAAFKLARRQGREVLGPHGPRSRILALEDSFHGRTVGSLAMTAKKAYREPFEPLPSGVEHIAPTIEALEAAVDDTVSALIVEPVRGEAGVRPLPQGWLRRARELTREHGALLIVDEVQTGIGRTGRWFAASEELSGAEAPDAMTLAKGLGGGFPIGAMLTFGEHASGLLEPGQHGTTFGGNPLATAAGLATLTTIEDEQILQNVRSVGQHLADGLRAIDGVAEVRAHGLLIGIDLEPIDRSASQTAALAPAVVAAARRAGFIVNAPGPLTLRLAPPLILSAEQADELLEALPSILDAAREAVLSAPGA